MIEQGAEVSDEDRQTRDAIGKAYLKIEKAVDDSIKRRRLGVKAPVPQPIGISVPKEAMPGDVFYRCWLSAGKNKRALFFETADIRPGDFVVVRLPTESGGHGIFTGQLVSRCKDEAVFNFIEDAKPMTYRTEDYRIEGRVLFCVGEENKEIPPPYPVRPLRGITTQDAARIKELRQRLQRLSNEADITNCTEIIKLERQIYDLEHPALDDDSILNADWIG